MTRSTVGFEISVSARDDGTLEAVYIQLAEGPATRTKEIVDDVLLADYDARGRVIGLEILAPVKLADLARLVDKKRRKPFTRFVSTIAPRELVSAGNGA